MKRKVIYMTYWAIPNDEIYAVTYLFDDNSEYTIRVAE